MVVYSLPAPRAVSPEHLRDTATARRVELTEAVRTYVHWAVQLIYARIRAAAPTAAALTVEVVPGRPLGYPLAAVRDLAGQTLWSRGQADPAGQFAAIDALLADLVRWRAPDQLPGWIPDSTADGVYQVELRAVPPALDPDLGVLAPPEIARYLALVIAELAGLFNIWMPRIVQAVGEYARGLVEGWFPPLTDITAWASIPAALGYVVPTADTPDQLTHDQLDEDDWVVGIGSVHALADGVLESIDTGESYGEEDPLYVRVGFYSEELAARGLTVAELAGLFHGDVRLTAAVILQALAPTA